MNVATQIAPDDRLLTLKQVREIVPKDKATIYRWIGKGIFPDRYRIGPGSVGWLRSEILAWVAENTRRPPS
ncbi:helix-turn-helix transcriptional regulator [Sphingobium lactosutens]|uniref:AlpA family transcriptional regulator n=1 Tax=Sphingobium lactosutens DS20 TaxID=1331060 RepID=T0J1A5_9SPHN|nr:AlpA family phage regulatory protein [Sphingobium lactosutens]EQB15729.1 hypothetical protein RLDS_10665 [Sphingobium lactosutens DS20]